MSNWFGTSDGKPAYGFGISNGATDVLLAAVVMAGTPLARTPQEVRLVVWIASQDQALIGRGVAGFRAAELPWEAATFEADKAFVLGVLAAAKTRVGWDRLGYAPPPDRVDANLDRLAAAFAALGPEDVDWEDPREPILGWPAEIRICPLHRAFEHAAGCLACNEGG